MFFKILGLLSFVSSFAFAAEKIGLVSAVTGDVKVDNQRVKPGAPFTAQSVIQTGNGKCTLLIGHDTVVHLDKASQLNIADYQKQNQKKEELNLDLKFGRLRAMVAHKKDQEKKFNIKTRTAVMGIRGTHIYIDSPRDIQVPPTFLTIEGVAEVRALPTIQIAASGKAAGDTENKTGSNNTGIIAASGEKKESEKRETATAGPSGGSGTGPDTKPGRGPATGDSGVVVLGANQMVNGAGPVSIDPGTAIAMSHSIAPPPPPVRNATDLNQRSNNSPPPPPPPMANGPGGDLPMMPPMMPPPLDPVANSQQAFPVNVGFTP